MLTKPDVVDVHDGRWTFASKTELTRDRVFPNGLAYQRETEHLALILKRSTGGDFAMGVAGLNFLTEVLENGKLPDGRAVAKASVVLVGVDPNARRLGMPIVIQSFTLKEIVDRFRHETPREGRLPGADYFWLQYGGDPAATF